MKVKIGNTEGNLRTLWAKELTHQTVMAMESLGIWPIKTFPDKFGTATIGYYIDPSGCIWGCDIHPSMQGV